MKTSTRAAKRISVLLAAAAAIVACAEERAPVDRVQPYALPKAFFIGEQFGSADDDPEFWTQNTVIDVGFGAAQNGLFTSTYAQPMARIRWQITESLLVGRAAYERIEGSDGKGIATGLETQDGVVACAFPITSHFDIVHAYNSTTGERLNIVEENATDRPWYEREFFRVDWSQNLNTDSYDFDTLSLIGVLGGVAYEPLAYYVSDPQDEEAPFFDLDGGYFDVTTKAFATPGVVDLSSLGWGVDEFPACMLDGSFQGGTAPYGSCNPVELTLRHSFRRVIDDDYEPANWDGWRFQAFGGFTVERAGYTRAYGMTDNLHRYFLSRYNIWERSHYYASPNQMIGPVECFTPASTPVGADPHRDENGDGTEDECEHVTVATGVGGSKCDEFSQKCTLPYRLRQPKVTAWYYTNGGDPRFFEATELAAHEWDVALRTSVRVARYTECMATGGDKDDCVRDWPVYFGQQDDNDDAIALALEMDDCRSGRAYGELGRDPEACAERISEIGAARGATEGVVSVAQMEEMLVLCHSPVELGDPAACGPAEERLPEGVTAAACDAAREAGDADLLATCLEARNARRGDLRYHQVNAIAAPQTPSPWGIYTDAEDPLTAEKVSASINVWTSVNDFWAQRLVDYVRFAAGELTAEDVTDGEHVADWAEAARAAAGAAGPRFTKGALDERISQLTTGRDDALAPGTESAIQDPEFLASIGRLHDDLTGVIADAQEPTTSAAAYSARLERARGTQTEAAMMTPMIQQFYGVDGLAMDGALMDLASPIRGGSLTLQRDVGLMKQNALAERGICMMDAESSSAAPMAIAGLEGILEGKFEAAHGAFGSGTKTQQKARADAMVDYVARRAHTSVIAHEMGHSIGLRHNFLSSSDAFNYRPQYWQLRTDDGAITAKCDTLSDGEDCVGPRYFDPITENETQNLLEMWAHSSIMEYAGEPTQDFLGIGAYDFAAAHMLYGDDVAVYPTGYADVSTGVGQGIAQKLDNFGGIVGIQYKYGTTNIHYTDLQAVYGLISDCADVDPNAFVPARYDPAKDGAFHPVLDGELVSADGASYSRCRQPEVDYVPWTGLGPLLAPIGYMRAQFEDTGWIADAQGRLRVPYGFATDRWADLGNASVYRHDAGADVYEIFNFLVAQQELLHIFDNYRRNRATFTPRGAFQRTIDRYNSKIRDGAKGLGLMRNIYKEFHIQSGIDFDTAWPQVARLFYKDNVIGAGLVFDHFTRSTARPETGEHYRDGDGVLRSVEDSYVNNPATVVTVPDGAYGPANPFVSYSPGGRLVENRLDDSLGEYSSEYTLNAGSYYDKAWAAMMLTESVDNFISDSRGDFVDKRYRSVSMADLFPEAYRRWLGNNLTGDARIKGVQIAADTAGDPLVDADGFPADGLSTTTWWADAPMACFPSDGASMCVFPLFGGGDGGKAAEQTAPLDPQIGWEQQLFLINWTLAYLPENQQQWWVNNLRLWEIGVDADPAFENRIEFHDPLGKVYVAKAFGKEAIFGETVQKGIAARVLEYANGLLSKAYETTPVDNDGDGVADWYLPVIDTASGEPVVLYDPAITGGDADCSETDDSGCTCAQNHWCRELETYVEVPFYLRQALDDYGICDPDLTGTF